MEEIAENGVLALLQGYIVHGIDHTHASAGPHEVRNIGTISIGL